MLLVTSAATTGGRHARRAEAERMKIDKFQVQDGYECPTCEKVLNTSLGLKQHHTKVHDESLQPTSECQWCGETFGHGPKRDANFCSRECQMKRREKEGLPAKKRRVIVQCPSCDEGFEVRHSEVGHKTYCSRECRYDGEYIDCEQCGEEFYAYDTYVDDARFCSQECYGVWLSQNKSGSDSWHWKGGSQPNYGPGWTERKREQVRDRDRRRCTECGMHERNQLEKRDMKLHVHHIVNARESSNPAVYNAMRNLRSLCISCHLSKH